MRLMTRLTLTLFILSILHLAAAPAAVVTLKDGSVYSGIGVNRFDGGDRRFSVEKDGTVVRIQMGEIDSIEFDNVVGRVTLRDGSVYSAVNIVGFDGRMDRFQVYRAGAAVDVRAIEIGTIDFNDVAVGGVVPLPIPVPVAVPVVPEEVTPAGVSTAEEFIDENPRESITAEEKAQVAERLKAGAINVPIGDPSDPSEWEIGIDAPIEEARASVERGARGWSDDALYSNLPEDFGKIKIAPQSKDDKPTGYVPRWKDTTSKTKSSTRGASKSDKADAGKSRTARSSSRRKSSPRSTKARASGDAAEGASDRALANADSSNRSTSRDRRSSRSRGSSARGGSSRDRDNNSRGGSRFGFDSFGGSGRGNSGGGQYGGGQYGGGRGSYGGGYGGGGGSSYGRSSYGGGGGSSYGGGGGYGGRY